MYLCTESLGLSVWCLGSLEFSGLGFHVQYIYIYIYFGYDRPSAWALEGLGVRVSQIQSRYYMGMCTQRDLSGLPAGLGLIRLLI